MGCLDFSCSLNKTTQESLSRALGIKRLPTRFREQWRKPIAFNSDQAGNLIEFKNLLDKDPKGGWLPNKRDD
jgi:hypothetical protein